MGHDPFEKVMGTKRGRPPEPAQDPIPVWGEDLRDSFPVDSDSLLAMKLALMQPYSVPPDLQGIQQTVVPHKTYTTRQQITQQMMTSADKSALFQSLAQHAAKELLIYLPDGTLPGDIVDVEVRVTARDWT
jgi:hypothetical protein